jgi:hypothetical protein
MGAGMLLFALNLLLAHRHGMSHARDDPWGGDTLEWAMPSPAPNYNFLGGVRVASPEPMWDGISEVPGGTGRQRAGADREPRPWEERLDRPEAGLREALATTGLDARPDHIVTLPGHSLWPLWLALAIALALIGVLVNGVPLALVGLAGIIASTGAWLWPGVE